jgi:hypothetical protein
MRHAGQLAAQRILDLTLLSRWSLLLMKLKDPCHQRVSVRRRNGRGVELGFAGGVRGLFNATDWLLPSHSGFVGALACPFRVW